MTKKGFTKEQKAYYNYLRRRLTAGEAGQRISMGAVFIASNRLSALLKERLGAAGEGGVAEVTDEMKALCDLLYIDMAKYVMQDGEGDAQL
jgi:hypothetical protein